MCYIYIIQCRSGNYYTGYTPDLCRRMSLHLAGKGGKYTRAFPPEKLAAAWCCDSDTGARRLEYAIKHHLSREQKTALIAAPETVASQFPQLAAYTYRPIHHITLSDCAEGRLNG